MQKSWWRGTSSPRTGGVPTPGESIKEGEGLEEPTDMAKVRKFRADAARMIA